jgi:type II secretory pathway component GspD/PulD (secretin)
MKPWHLVSFVVIAAQLTAAPAGAQDPGQPSASPRPTAPIVYTPNMPGVVTPLKIVVTLLRYEGEKKVSSLPYTLSVNAIGGNQSQANLRMGTQVPIPSGTMLATAPAKDAPKQINSFSYKEVGTNIDVNVRPTDGERFRVDVTVSDSSVLEDKAQPKGTPSLRNFSAANSVVLKDGQSAQFSTAPDKVTGEIVKIDVSLSVVK